MLIESLVCTLYWVKNHVKKLQSLWSMSNFIIVLGFSQTYRKYLTSKTCEKIWLGQDSWVDSLVCPSWQQQGQQVWTHYAERAGEGEGEVGSMEQLSFQGVMVLYSILATVCLSVTYPSLI